METVGMMLRKRVRSRLLLMALVSLALFPSALSAHHIMGIPHYKYGDDYPQIPYMEVVAQMGKYDLDFTHFPGFPVPGERVRFKLYIRHRETDEVFRDPLRVEVVRKRFMSDAAPVAAPFEIRTGIGPEKNDYKFFLEFKEAEAFEVQVHFPTAKGVEVISFPVVIGETDDRPLIFGAMGILAGAVIAVGVVRNRRKGGRARRATRIA